MALLDSTDYEDAIRLAISLGGDADTLACITGGIAEAFYGGVPESIARPAWALLDERLRQTVLRLCDISNDVGLVKGICKNFLFEMEDTPA